MECGLKEKINMQQVAILRGAFRIRMLHLIVGCEDIAHGALPRLVSFRFALLPPSFKQKIAAVLYLVNRKFVRKSRFLLLLVIKGKP